MGEARSGAFAQDLAANLDARLRFSAVVLLLLAAGLVAVRDACVDLLVASVDGLVWPAAWPSGRSLVLVGAPTLLALALRLTFLNQPMRYDEALSFNEFASRPLYYGLSFYPDPNNHLLNTLLVHVAAVGLGNQPWVLRLPALLGGVLLAPATYWLTRLLFPPFGAVVAAMLTAGSSYLVEYSTNARGYTLQALCFVVLLGLVIVAARRQSRAALLGAAVVGALGAYAVPTMLYGVAIAAVWLVYEQRRVRARSIRLGHVVASGLLLGLLVALAYLPVMLVSGPDKLAANRFVVPLGLTELASELPRSLGRTFGLWNRDVPWPFAALLVAGFALGSRRVPLGMLAVGVCLALVLLQRVAPFERVWLFLLPLYFAVAAGGLARLVDGRLLGVIFGGVLSVVALTSGSILASTETGAFPDAQAVAQTLGPRLAPDDAVVTRVPASLPELQYYFPRSGLPMEVLVRPPDEAQNVWVVAPPGTPADLPGRAAPVEVARFSGSSVYELRR
jgi:hypothetical protein